MLSCTMTYSFLLTTHYLPCPTRSACTLPSCITTSLWSSYSSRAAPTAARPMPPVISSTTIARSTSAEAASASRRAWGARTLLPTYSPTATARPTPTSSTSARTVPTAPSTGRWLARTPCCTASCCTTSRRCTALSSTSTVPTPGRPTSTATHPCYSLAAARSTWRRWR